MKKKYNNPEFIIIELDQLDVITTSGEMDALFEGGIVSKNDDFWSNKY